MDKTTITMLTPAREITGITIVDFASGADGDIRAIATALEKQLRTHFSLPPPYGWGLDATIRVAKDEKDIAPHEWVLGLYAHPDQPGALGYHDRTASGLPLMKIFPQLDMQEGTPWSITASHEIMETLVDPELSRCVQSPSGHFWALEVCDFVESDSYLIDGIAVSNFNLPLAFEPLSNIAIKSLGGKAKPLFDHMGLSPSAFYIRPGGYGQWWDGRKWITAEPRLSKKRGARYLLDDCGLSRHSRRSKLHQRAHFGDPRFML